MILRDYQEAAVQALWDYFERHTGNPLVAMPTGTGKSLVIAAFIRRVHDRFPGTNVMLLTHVKELIEQNFAKMLDAWPTAPAGIYSAGLGRREAHHPITFAGIASVAKRPDDFRVPDLIIIDEAHLVSPKQETLYRQFLDAMLARNPRLKVIGLSATCYRLGLGSLTLGGIFTDICFDLTGVEAFNWLISQGYLAPLHAVRTSYRLNVDGVKLSGGDYVQAQLQAALDHPDITQKALAELAYLGQGRQRWLIFASGVDHAEHCAELLDSWGIAARAIHSKLDPYERSERYENFKAGRLRCAVSMNAMTTGVDVPEIDMIGMLRPTKSSALWVQMLGRGTRPAPWANKADCLVADFTNNTRDLGPINDPVLPTRPGEKRGSGTAPVRVCSGCKSYVHARATVCPYCGQEFGTSVNISAESAGLEVMRLDDPVVEEIPVKTVSYSRVTRKNRPTVMLVTYFCPGKEGNIPLRFTQYVCLEHEGAAQRYAHRWWRENCPHLDPPETVQRAIDLSKHLRIPRALRVWINKSRPEIMSYVYE